MAFKLLIDGSIGMCRSSVMADGAFAGAGAGLLLTVVIEMARKSYRCKESCDHLLSTLVSLKPLYDDVCKSTQIGDTGISALLKTMDALLEQAKEVLGGCVVKKRWWSFNYQKKFFVASRIRDIDKKIFEELPKWTLPIYHTVREIKQGMLAPVVTPPMVLQPVPAKIVAFEKNPFEQVKKLVLTAGNGNDEPLTIGLKGRGGAGKTLIAQMVNNDKDVQGKYGMVLWITIGQDASMAGVYKSMGKSLNNGGVFERDHAHKSLEDQRSYLMEALKLKKVLLILDDVWANSCNGHCMIYWLDICKGVGSTTLITTRDGTVLQYAKAQEKIDIQSLSGEESWRLFRYHAFETNGGLKGEVENVAREICEECKGLPLALKVVAGALWGKKDVDSWRLALKQLKATSFSPQAVKDELFNSLKYSYDGLEEDLKTCFLYFAAFPEDYEISTKELCSIWLAEKMFGDHDDEDMAQQMADRSLIDLSEDGSTAKIHDVLRDLAFRIIHEAKDGEWASECHFEPGKNLKKFPRIKETVKRVSFRGSSIADWFCNNQIELPNVQVLLLSGVSTREWKGFLEHMIRCMKKVVYLDLSWCSSLVGLPEGIKEWKSLTNLDLSLCRSLVGLPEGIKEWKSLTNLDLSWCSSLVGLPEGIKEWKSLTNLNSPRCTSLKELPKGIKEWKSLTNLDLSWCSSLVGLPEGIKEWKSLTNLDLSWCSSLVGLPEGIKEWKSLTNLDLSWCHSLVGLPEGIKEWKSLTNLDLSWCHSLVGLPEGIKEWKSLTNLNSPQCTSLKELPKGIKEWKSLTNLDLSWCSSLVGLPEGIKEWKSLTNLDLSWCHSLVGLPEGIKEWKSLTNLNLQECTSLKELPEGIKEWKSLTNLNLRQCTSLKEVPEGIKEWKSLTYLDLSWCSNLVGLPECIKEWKSLTNLDLSGCHSLVGLPEGIKEWKSLTILKLRGYTSLKELPEGIKEWKSLTYLDLSWCSSLVGLPEGIKEWKSFTNLDLSWCSSLVGLPEGIKECKSLTKLNLRGCKSLKELPESIKEMKSLSVIDIH